MEEVTKKKNTDQSEIRLLPFLHLLQNNFIALIYHGVINVSGSGEAPRGLCSLGGPGESNPSTHANRAEQRGGV